MPNDTIIICNTQHSLRKAKTLASELGCELHLDRDPKEFSSMAIALLFDESGVSLQVCGDKAPGPVRAEFVTGKLGYRRQQKNESNPDIAKAVGVQKSRSLSVLDLTAGLGQDAFVLAHLGCDVTLMERNPFVSTLLLDAMARAKIFSESSDPLLEKILRRMKIIPEDSHAYLRSLEDANKPDVIYIDPMFPERSKSAKVKKAMQVFHSVVGADEDSETLLELALRKATHRVVVKRPLRSDFLADKKPSLKITGRAVRFDVYPLKKLS